MTSTPEMYMRAVTSTQLALDPHHHSQADTLIAAGMAVQQHRHRDLALRVWRLRTSGEMHGARALAEELTPIVMRMSAAGRGRAPSIKRTQAKDLAIDTLKWWCFQTCPACHGRGHPVIPGTPHLDTTRECHHCSGTGIRPLRKCVKRHPELAQKLVDRLNALSGLVFSEMARKLARDMEGFELP
jgi:hypothetical protein